MQSEQQRALRNTIPDAIGPLPCGAAGKTAIRFGERAWTYRQLDEAAARVPRAGAMGPAPRRPRGRLRQELPTPMCCCGWLACAAA